MKRLLLAAIIAAVVFFYVSCESTSKLVFPQSSVVSEDFAGIVHAGGTRTQREYAYMDQLGVRWILHTLNWGNVEPEQGDWDFLLYDDLVNKNKAAGVKIIGLLAYDNWWIHDDMEGHRYVPMHRIPDFAQYARKMAEHFRGRVDAWCIWNEPNFNYFWTGTDEEFIELHRQTAAAIREVDSEVIILGGAFNRNVSGLPEKFIRKLFESGAMEQTDAVAFHPYELNPARTAFLYNRFKKIVGDYGFGDKIWLTEVGYPTGGWYPTKVAERRFPEYVIKTWTLLAAGGAQKLLWYQLFDPFRRNRNSSEAFFGLVHNNRDYSSKGAEAFRLCAGFISGTECYAIEPGADGVPRRLRAFWFKGAENSALVLWNEGFGSRKVNLQITGTAHALHDIVTGNASPIPAETVVKVGKTPVFLTWQGEERPVIR